MRRQFAKGLCNEHLDKSHTEIEVYSESTNRWKEPILRRVQSAILICQFCLSSVRPSVLTFPSTRRGVDPGGWGGPDPLKICTIGQSMFRPPENVTFFHSKLLYNCKFHNIEDEQLDTITSLILLMLTMLPSLCLISCKQTLVLQSMLLLFHGA